MREIRIPGAVVFLATWIGACFLIGAIMEVGSYLSRFLSNYFPQEGAWVVMVIAIGIGLLFAKDKSFKRKG